MSQNPQNLIGHQALVVGGTAGIGKAIALRLASLGTSVTVAGRSAEAGAAVVAQMRSSFAARGLDAGAEAPIFSFCRLDASSLRETHAFAIDFRATQGDRPLDFLVMCQSAASFGGRQETPEGLELKLCLHAYSRVLLTCDLLPLLRLSHDSDPTSAPTAGRVLSVLSGGVHGAFADWADPDLKSSFSLKRAADAAGVYNDFAFSHLAADRTNASVGFLHAAPGFVASNWGHQTMAGPLIKVMQRLFAKTTDACAQVMVNALLDARYARGFHCVNERGEPVAPTSAITAENLAAMQVHLDHLWTRVLGQGPLES